MILVVNADDAGVDPPRNRGILRAAKEGIVRSASLLVNFEAARGFVEAASAVAGLGIGLHLNVTEGSPLVGGHRSLVGAGGRFLGKHEVYRRAAAGLVDAREARREIEAQWSRLEAWGVRPTHLDGHNHAHLFPGIADAVAETIPGGTWVRRPPPGNPGAPLPAEPYASPGARIVALSGLSARALSAGWLKFKATSRFEGVTLPRGYGPEDLISLLHSIACDENDVVELMTHPGERCDTSVQFSASPDREREVASLTHPSVLAFIRAEGIRLETFGGLA
jgi:predicted glycoside hydrolase/deacetylase ChbG (UPF0249 family)